MIDLCALAGALVIDPDGAYDPRLVNDSLLLGLTGTMSEYELSMLRQRGISARDSKAQRGGYRLMLPLGLCWNDLGKIDINPDEHVAGVVRLVCSSICSEKPLREPSMRSEPQSARHLLPSPLMNVPTT